MHVGEAGVSVDHPPHRLYQYWVNEGPVSSTSRRPQVYRERLEARAEREEAKNERSESSSMMTEWREMMKAGMEQTMMMSMGEMNEKMQDRMLERMGRSAPIAPVARAPAPAPAPIVYPTYPVPEEPQLPVYRQ